MYFLSVAGVSEFCQGNKAAVAIAAVELTVKSSLPKTHLLMQEPAAAYNNSTIVV